MKTESYQGYCSLYYKAQSAIGSTGLVANCAFRESCSCEARKLTESGNIESEHIY